MQFLLLQTFAWMLMTGLVGAILGCLARRMFGARDGEAVAVQAAAPTAAAHVKPAAAPAMAAARTPSAPVVEASKAPAPVAPPAPATTPDRGAGSAYSYPISTVGIPRGVPEKVQPQIQTINLPAAATAGAASVAAAVTIRQPAATAGGTAYPITTVGIPRGYVETPAPAKPAAPAAPDAARFEAALAGEPGQPRPEPLRPELARNTSAAPAASAPAAPAAKVAPPAPAAAPAAPAPVAAPSVAATVSPRVGTVANAPIESKPAGIAAGSPPVGPIASKPAGIPAPAEAAAKPAPAATAKPAQDVPFEPVVAGGAALAAIAARAASASAAAAASVAPATVAPSAPPAPAAAKPAAASPPADDLMRIRSIDSTLQTRLRSVGVQRFAEIARWTPADVSRISQSLGLTGRIEQENWIEQAQILATGGETEYSRRRLRGEIPTVAPVAAAPAAPAAPASVPATPVAPAAPAAPAASVAPPAAPKSAIDTSTAAATAAAAAMASAAITRATANVEPAMPSKLVDAIRENLTKPAAAAAPGPAPAAASDAGRTSRPDLAGLRSVRSEALRDGPLAGSRGADDLKRIRGIGVLIEKKLNSLGVTGYEQIANWTIADIDRVSQILDFKGRIERENWVEQARILASGGQTEFSKRVDRGEA